eukprot:765802-Hanusia_phi.AAC.6
MEALAILCADTSSSASHAVLGHALHNGTNAHHLTDLSEKPGVYDNVLEHEDSPVYDSSPHVWHYSDVRDILFSGGNDPSWNDCLNSQWIFPQMSHTAVIHCHVMQSRTLRCYL